MTNFKRFLVILLSFSACWISQMILLPMIPHLVTVPNLLLVEVITVGFLFGKGCGLFTGVAAGLVLDLLGVGIPGFFTLILSLLGYLDGLLSEKIDSELVAVLFVIFTVNEAVFHGYFYALSFLLDKELVFMTYLREVFVPELVLSLLCFMVLYGILLMICNQWDLRVNKGEIKIV